MRASNWALLRSSPLPVHHARPRHSTIACQSSNSNPGKLFDFTSLLGSPGDTTDTPETKIDGPECPQVKQSEHIGESGQGRPHGSSNGSNLGKPKDPNYYGSASNRARRSKSPKELPPVHIPDWFLEKNITLFEDIPSVSQSDLPSSFKLPKISRSPFKRTIIRDLFKQTALLDGFTQAEHHENSGSLRESTSSTDVAGSLENEEKNLTVRMVSESTKFRQDLSIPWPVLMEMFATLKVILRPPPLHYIENPLGGKSHMILYCPIKGASRMLLSEVKQISSVLPGDCDYIELDAQDIAEIGGGYMESSTTFEPNSLSSLGYDTFLPPTQRQDQASEVSDLGDYLDEEEFTDSRETANNSSAFWPDAKPSRAVPNVGANRQHRPIYDLRKALASPGLNNLLKGSPSSSAGLYVVRDPREPRDTTEDLKMGLLIETLLGAPERKIKSKKYLRPISRPLSKHDDPHPATNTPNSSRSEIILRPTSKNLIIFVEDYLQISETPNGNKFLTKLHEAVDLKRNEGRSVMIVSTSTGREFMPTLSNSAVNNLQMSESDGPTRTIFVPVIEKTSNQVLVREHKNKIRTINLRHLKNMIYRLAPPPEGTRRTLHDLNDNIDSKAAFLADLDKSVWPMDHVNKIATIALAMSPPEDLSWGHINRALVCSYDTEEAKYAWVRQEREEEINLTKKFTESDTEERIRKLKEKCNSYEKRLLSGVVDAKSIKTTFADIQAPQETVDALKTLTSLSLVRPDAFTYGVLASDRIPGLLLYGPPGTGKTLLAKAVAKESASTMLEVSGSDVYNMYVGEGEKNIRAIFSLARKLAPCVVFIDEADAILGSRSGSSNRTSHRDLINQFLREWDGMTDSNAFIMVATNRPFDLDEASLRRLPRRLLIDLPVESDREAILKIHLKDEMLDPDVSLSKLAAETPFYSGSDLKNLCVAAALACVREELDIATEHNKNIIEDTHNAAKYQYATKRTLYPRHFTKGMDEISASISEDMGSLKALRKFDEKYGDRKGRRKKMGGYGFGTVKESELKESDAARIRNQ